MTGHQAHLREAQSTKSPAELLRAIPVLKPGGLRAHCCPGEPKKDGIRCDRPQTLKQKKDEDRKGKRSEGPDRRLSQVCLTDLRQERDSQGALCTESAETPENEMFPLKSSLCAEPSRAGL